MKSMDIWGAVKFSIQTLLSLINTGKFNLLLADSYCSGSEAIFEKLHVSSQLNATSIICGLSLAAIVFSLL